MEKKYRGGTAYIQFEHKNSSGTLVDVTTSAKVKGVDSSGAVVVPATTDLTHDGTGKYSENYTIPDDALTGVYKFQGIFTDGVYINKDTVVEFEVMEDI